jgi:dTDP-4-amino-4,6-dideoxygalactose transaminase
MSGVPSESATALSRAAEFALREVSLPIHPFLSDADLDRVVEACLAALPARVP